MQTLVVIVNWRTPALTVECLRTLAPEIDGRTRVVVTDNASGDDSVAVIGRAIADNNWQSWCTLLPLPRNGGFAYGNNRGIEFAAVEQTFLSASSGHSCPDESSANQQSPALSNADRNVGMADRNVCPTDSKSGGSLPEFIYLLNPDTTVFPGVISELVKFMQSNPRCGIAGSRAENVDGSVRKSAFRFITAAGEFERQAELGVVSKLLKNRAVGLPIPTSNRRVDWVSGCGLMIRREVIEKIGLLDEAYFMYFEETDFCLRAARAGFECWHVPTSRLIHFVGQASGVTGANQAKKRRPAYWFESRAHYFRKNFGGAYARLADAAWLSAYSISLMKRFALRKKNPDPPRLWRDFVKYNFLSRKKAEPVEQTFLSASPGHSCPDESSANQHIPALPNADRNVGMADRNVCPTASSEFSQEQYRDTGRNACATIMEIKPHPKIILGTTNQNPPGISFWKLVREDLRTHERDVFSQGFWALFQHRLGNWRMGLPRILRPPFTVLYRVLHKWVQWTCGISLAYTVKVGRRVHIWHFGGMILGAREIGDDVHIRQNVTFGVARRGDSPLLKPTLEARVDIGAGAVLAGGIRIGHDSVVGANAVVLKDVPPFSVVVGIPGKVIKTLEPKEDRPEPETLGTAMSRVVSESQRAEVA